jgi:hypothetical protein
MSDNELSEFCLNYDADENINLNKDKKEKKEKKENKGNKDIENDCSHKNTFDQLMPEEYIHYSKKMCLDCNKFITWNPNPNTIIKKEARNKTIEELKQMNLSSFERSFTTSIQTLSHLSPKQEEVWIKICDKYHK